MEGQYEFAPEIQGFCSPILFLLLFQHFAHCAQGEGLSKEGSWSTML